MTWSQEDEHLWPPVAGRLKVPFQSLWREQGPVDPFIPDFRPPELWKNCCVLRQPVCSNLLQQSEETDALFIFSSYC